MCLTILAWVDLYALGTLFSYMAYRPTIYLTYCDVTLSLALCIHWRSIFYFH
jgi:hypothetical protein